MEAEEFFGNLFVMLFGRKRTADFEDKLLLNDSRAKNVSGFIRRSVTQGIFLMVGTMIGAHYLFFGIEKSVAFGIIAFFVPFIINYIFQDIIFEKRKRKKESALPDLLLEASVSWDEKSLMENIKSFSQSDFELIAKDFARCYNEIKKGAGVEEALLRVKELNKSRAYSRVIELMLTGYESGSKLSVLLKECAEDLLEEGAIIKERQAIMLVTKYTLLISAGIIVPAILGLIISLVSGLDFPSGGMEIGLSADKRKEIFLFSVLGAQIYVFEYALLASFFLSLQEGNKKQFWIYALILCVVGGVAFALVRG